MPAVKADRPLTSSSDLRKYRSSRRKILSFWPRSAKPVGPMSNIGADQRDFSKYWIKAPLDSQNSVGMDNTSLLETFCRIPEFLFSSSISGGRSDSKSLDMQLWRSVPKIPTSSGV